MRQAEEVDEEVGCDGGPDRVGHHLRRRADESGDEAETPAAVTQFDELPFGKTLGFAPAVGAETGQRQYDTDRRGNICPECHAESGLVILFRIGNEGNDGKSGHQVAYRDHITAGYAAGRQIIHHSFDVSFGEESDPNDKCNRQDNDQPINPRHNFMSPQFFLGLLFIVFRKIKKRNNIP